VWGAETWTVRTLDQKYLESFEIWRWRRLQKITWTDHVRYEEILLRVNGKRKILQRIKKRKAKGGFTHSMPRPCRSPAMPCR